MLWNENSQRKGSQSQSVTPATHKPKQPPERVSNLTSILAANLHAQTPAMANH